MVHRKTCAKQAKHHGDKAPGHKARGARIELLRIRIGKLREENTLRAFNQLAVDDFTPAKRCGPER
ncbi:hypothetical protein SDC9_201664 [bioreactor metagenome]|uniref:Uncharacterized protein n=1 Tax=bioreactor metagenome TaxID=1076179 RepID=A0A645IRK3_9ZZZZ